MTAGDTVRWAPSFAHRDRMAEEFGEYGVIEDGPALTKTGTSVVLVAWEYDIHTPQQCSVGWLEVVR